MTIRDKLAALAVNLWWSWNPDALDLFRQLNPNVFRSTGNNPRAALAAADPAVLASKPFARAVNRTYETFQRYLRAAPLYGDAPHTSYFCMEYGLHESLPLYAGGLGILAGDHAKAASDLGLPFTAVGLFLRSGYFRQSFDASGWQQEAYPSVDPALHPLTLVTDEYERTVTVTVHLGRQPLQVQAWRLALGRTSLYLLDAAVGANPPALRTLTHRLYQGDRATRMQQEIVLGIGGLRLLRRLGVEADVYHMNEGHCAFLTLELLRERLEAGDGLPEAEAWVRERCVFTTHTPVMAGHDRFDAALFTDQMAGLSDQLGLSPQALLAYGRVHPGDDDEPFTMTVLGLKLSRQANGVSRLNGEVARRQWQHLYPGRPASQVPIEHVTNGVHLPTWTAPSTHAFLEAHLGDWKAHLDDPDFWQRVTQIPDAALWDARGLLRRRLIDFTRTHLQTQSLPQAAALDPDALTIGFARRFATYKRAPLLFADRDRAAALFDRADRPIQILYAGKAHPADETGKRFIQEIHALSRDPAFKGKLIFLENYNMEIGRMLVSGCDVWLNNPRRPLEASGTSGQKVTLHGGLNVSILDGWWPEGYDGTNGWAIGHAASADYMDPAVQDSEDARYLYAVLEGEVIPAFYDRDARGLPLRWIARMRRAMQTLPHAFSATRMLIDYIEQLYRAAAPVHPG